MKREYLIFFLLIGLSIVNTVMHFTHPAYKYYKENVKSVEGRLLDRQEKFEKKVIGDFLPAIYQAISNSYRVVNGSSASSSSVPSAYTSAIPQSKLEQRPVKQLEASFYLFRGVPCIEYNGITFQVGDNFDGSAITSLSPMMVRTEFADYEIRARSSTLFSERSIYHEKN